MDQVVDQLKTCSHLVVVEESAEIGKRLSDMRRQPAKSITWTNRGTTALRLVPSHYDSTWLVGEHLADMHRDQLLEMLYTIEPDLNVRLIDDWRLLGIDSTAVNPGRMQSDRLDDW